MRKDLKIGLAIGAVLLVVLIVYLAVPNQNDQTPHDLAAAGGDNASTEPGSSSGASSSSQDNAAASGSAGASAVKPEPSPRADAGSEPSPAGPAKDEQTAAADKPKVDPFAVWAGALDEGKLPVISETPVSLSATGDRTNPDTGAPIASPAGETAKPETPVVVEPPAVTAGEPVIVKPTETTATPPGTTTAERSASADSEAAAAGRPHKVRAGETYSSIAKVAYGDARYYLAIEKANPNVDPSRLKPGMTINLPDVETVKGPAQPAADRQKADESGKTIDSETEYRVKSGDNLHNIAVKRYGSSTMADKIYELNKATIGDDSARLKIGMVLKLPPNPNAGESQISTTR
jgi:nucleoid-associated protein YgaU